MWSSQSLVLQVRGAEQSGKSPGIQLHARKAFGDRRTVNTSQLQINALGDLAISAFDPVTFQTSHERP